MINVKQLNFGFGSPIITGLDLEIQTNGQVIALLGPNGAGKTTLLNILANLYQKYTGVVEFHSHKVFLLPDYEFIPKDMSLKDCLQEFVEVYDNFNEQRAEAMLKYLALDVNKKVASYSKGMKEQLHLVFALAQDVDVYLLDEPLAAVDPLTRDTLLDLIKQYRRENSVVILSTHLVQDMEHLFDEIIMLNNGKVILYQDVPSLLQRYEGLRLDSIYKEVQKHENLIKATF